MKIYKSKEQRNIVVVLLSICLICILLYVRQSYILKKCSKITIGIVNDVSFSNDSSIRNIIMSIYYANEHFSISRGNGEKYIPSKGERYFVKIACESPNMGEAFWDIPVPDTLKYIPTNGWDELPYGLGQKK